jgi:hypothetical protein
VYGIALGFMGDQTREEDPEFLETTFAKRNYIIFADRINGISGHFKYEEPD